MDISIIIVNYNVKHFLDQCLSSIRKSIKDLSTEIFVVDNNSADGSCALIKEKYPEAHLIENTENLGFSKANNQAIRMAQGKYILLLNPDTVIEEHTLQKCYAFMEEHADCGSLGVKLIDGSGHFLPESKRSLPTPMVAFYKMFGLSYLFPKSKIFGRYHLGFLNREQTHEVEVLPGAFMMIRKSVLDSIGLLDESFFMYGEDIDLSYRIIKAGYKNYYYPETTIIHYKGESTKKGSINYVLMFYRAMIVFAEKHFSRKNAAILNVLIHIAIYLRAGVAIMRRFINKILLPSVDAVTMYAGLLLIVPAWSVIKFGETGAYAIELMIFMMPAYILIWLIALYFSEAYERPIMPFRIINGIISGTILILIMYALLPDFLRFSRILIFLGALWALASLIANRYVLHFISPRRFRFSDEKKHIVIVGNSEEANTVKNILQETQIKYDLIGFVCPENIHQSGFIGHISNIEEIVKINDINEVIFCNKDIPSKTIIKNMLKLSALSVEFKIFNTDAFSIIGSSSIHTTGEIYTVRFDSIGKNINRTKKRLLDIVMCIINLICLPILIVLVKNKLKFLHNILLVFWGTKSWVGYCPPYTNGTSTLPSIRPGILDPSHGEKAQSKITREQLNMFYAKNYTITTDMYIILKGLRHLDN